jgi:hypothetical protein
MGVEQLHHATNRRILGFLEKSLARRYLLFQSFPAIRGRRIQLDELYSGIVPTCYLAEGRRDLCELLRLFAVFLVGSILLAERAD